MTAETTTITSRPDVADSTQRAGWSALQLQTPVLSFFDVAAGFSRSLPILVTSKARVAIDLEVVSPPLAPFSVADAGPRARSLHPGEGSSAKIWIRYDAASPMATDSGRITVADRITGQQWTIALDGRGSLAGQYSELWR